LGRRDSTSDVGASILKISNLGYFLRMPLYLKSAIIYICRMVYEPIPILTFIQMYGSGSFIYIFNRE